MKNYNLGPVEMNETFVYTFFPLLAVVLLALYLKTRESGDVRESSDSPPYRIHTRGSSQRVKNSDSISGFLSEPITPLEGSSILSAAPFPFRPFKPVYHMTMGLEKCLPNDLFMIDSVYPSRIALRKKLVAQYPRTTIGTSPEAEGAVKELYTYLISHHLPQRYPGLFTANDGVFTNSVSGEAHPVIPPENSIDALKILATTIEEDVLILLKDDEGETYNLRAFVACFPSGFDSSKKMGMALRDIHKPVPMFEEKLAVSMDRFFGRLEVGRWVRRFNWTIATDDRLCVPSGSHLHEQDDVPEELKTVDLEKTYLRVERQVLFRLPRSRAMVFFVRTYMTPLMQVKEEGLGEALATAIDGIPEEVGWYKRRVVWGRAVKQALRA